MDLILVSQSNGVDYEGYSKLPLDRLDLYETLVYPRMVHHEGQFRSHLDYINFKKLGQSYAEAPFVDRRRLPNNLEIAIGERTPSRELSRPLGFNVRVIPAE